MTKKTLILINFVIFNQLKIIMKQGFLKSFHVINRNCLVGKSDSCLLCIVLNDVAKLSHMFKHFFKNQIGMFGVKFCDVKEENVCLKFKNIWKWYKKSQKYYQYYLKELLDLQKSY